MVARIETGTAWELVLSTLHVADRRRERPFDNQRAWRARARTVSRETRATLRRLGFHAVINLLGVVADLSGGRQASDFLSDLSHRPPADLAAYAIGFHRRIFRELTPPEVIAAALAGDRAARQEVLRTSYPDEPDWQATVRFLTSRSAADVGAQIRDALMDWHLHAFSEVERDVGEAQRRQRKNLVDEREAWTLHALMAKLLPGFTFTPAPTVNVVSFVPDAVIRPASVFLDHAQDYIAVFPIRDASEDPSEPPAQLVRVANALGDELRLRALKLIAQRPRGLADLANELGVPRTSLSYHIGVLRRAGLVTTGVEDGRWGRLRLADGGVDDVPRLFRDFLTSTGIQLSAPGTEGG
jgi:DNA-binding transcriptional ArsR family regulator